MTDYWAPNFSLTVNNNRVTADVRALISTVEYESVDGMADLLKIVINDTLDERGRLLVRDSKLFMPGNEVSFFCGYGTRLRHIGRAMIRKVRPIFPAGGAPTIEVIGYTKDAVMADTGPEPLKETRHMKKGGTRVKNSKAGRRWKDAKLSDAVADRASAYGFKLDIDSTPEAPGDFIQKANMRDYDFIQGISNLTGFYFWVDGDANGDWTLHFRDPSKTSKADFQDKEYTFKYADGDYSTIQSFEPEFAIQTSITKLTVQTKDPLTGRVMEASIEEAGDDGEGDLAVAPGNIRPGTDISTGESAPGGVSPKGQEIEGSLLNASDVKIFIDDFSFDVRSNRRFRNEADLANWAAAWFRKNRQNFLMSRGTLIGVESLAARQQHKFVGLGRAYDGPYAFTRVRHIFSAESGYNIDFSARRVVSDLPPVTSASELQVIDLLTRNS